MRKKSTSWEKRPFQSERTTCVKDRDREVHMYPVTE